MSALRVLMKNELEKQPTQQIEQCCQMILYTNNQLTSWQEITEKTHKSILFSHICENMVSGCYTIPLKASKSHVSSIIKRDQIMSKKVNCDC